MYKFLFSFLCFLALVGTASALPKSTTTYYQSCSYVWTYNDATGYMDQVYVCGDPIPEPAVEEEVPYEGCYYGEDCYDDYVGDP